MAAVKNICLSKTDKNGAELKVELTDIEYWKSEQEFPELFEMATKKMERLIAISKNDA